MLIGDLLRLQNGARLARDIAAGLRAGQAFAAAYTRAKRAAGVADFNDLIEWTRRLLRAARHGRLGALQARSAGRPCPRRRGAGHQCRAVGDHRAAGRRVFQRVEREPRAATGPCSWSATSSRRSTASRAPIRASSGRRARRSSGAPPQSGAATTCSATRRAPRSSAICRSPPAFARRSRCSTWSTPSSKRSVAEAMALSEAAPADTGAHHAERPGSVELWQPFAVEESPDDSDEGEERWVSLRDRQYAEALAERVRSLVEEAPMLALDQAAADARRHPGPRPEPRRTRFADRRAAVFRGRAGRRRRPAAPARAARGSGPARGGEVRGAAERRPQPRLPARLAADRVGPGRSCASSPTAGRASLWRELRAARGRVRGSAHEALSELLRMADFTHAVALPGNDPDRADAGTAQALFAPRDGGARPDRRADEQRAGVRAQRNRVARPLPRMVLARHASMCSAILASQPTKSG